MDIWSNKLVTQLRTGGNGPHQDKRVHLPASDFDFINYCGIRLVSIINYVIKLWNFILLVATVFLCLVEVAEIMELLLDHLMFLGDNLTLSSMHRLRRTRICCPQLTNI